MSTEDGRPLTGRAVTSRKLRVDELPALDLADLRRIGALADPYTREGGNIWALEDGLELNRVRLKYVVLADQGRLLGVVAWPYSDAQSGLPDDTSFWALRFTRTWPHFARRTPRHWFRAPCCETRRRAIYLLEGRWVCRACAGLSYESRQKHRLGIWEIAQKPLAAQMAYFAEVERPRVNRRRLMAAWRRLKRAHQAALAYQAGVGR